MSPLYVKTAEEGEEICDFCSSPDVQWTFPCRDFQDTVQAKAVILPENSSPFVRTGKQTGVFVGDWAACPACHALILRGDRQRLARRSAKRLIKKLAAEDIFISLGNLTAHLRGRQDNFWANRQGPPFPASDPRTRRGRTP